MKYCTYCGNQLADEADVCVKCGRIVGTANKNETSGENGIAIVALVAAFIIPLVGLILGIIGYQKSKQLSGKNKGIAIAAIIISSVSMVVGLIGSIISFAFYGAFFEQLLQSISSYL